MRIGLLHEGTLYPLAGEDGVAETVHSSAGDITIEADHTRQRVNRVRAANAMFYDRLNLATTVRFSTTRTFSTVAAAELWSLDYDAAMPRTGALVLESTTGTRYLHDAIVSPPDRRVYGCSVALSYTVQGGAISAVNPDPPLVYFVAVGDSITDRSTVVWNATGQNGIGYDQRGWAAILEQISSRRLTGLGPTEANTYKVGSLWDRDHGYSGITAHAYINGSEVYGDFLPIDDAIAANPHIYLVHIGTNDVQDQTAETVVNRVRAVWLPLVATGVRVVGTDILQRASAHNSPTIKAKIIAINTALRAAWEEDGLFGYRQWDDLVVKDEITGYAADSEYPDNAHPTNPDGIHPGADLARQMAEDMWSLLEPLTTGIPVTIPASDSAEWVTPNPYVSGDVSGLATGWAVNFLGDSGVDTIYTKTVDADGNWQRVEIVAETLNPSSYFNQGLYSRITNESGAVTALIGAQLRATARVRIPEGQGLSTVGISVQCVGATGVEDWIYPAWGTYQTDVAPIESYDATIYCDPFTVPAGTTQIWILITPGRGTGIFEFQKAGLLMVEEPA